MNNNLSKLRRHFSNIRQYKIGILLVFLAIIFLACQDPGSIIKYTVSFDTGGQGASLVSPQSVNEGGKATQPPAPTREGFNFGNWYKDSAHTQVFNFASELITADITLYASWEQPLLSFDTGEGSPIDPQEVAYGGMATEPTAPSRTDYKFEGWYKDSAYEQAFAFSTQTITANITIYAKWSCTLCSVTFDLAGGTGAFPPLKVATGSPATNPTPWPYDGNPAVPQKTAGSNTLFFGAWYTESDPTKQDGTNKFDFATVISSDLTLYARWYGSQPADIGALQSLLTSADANTDLNFIDVRKVTSMYALSRDGSAVRSGMETFNGDISRWDTSKVTSMEQMFFGAVEFNQPIGAWDVSSVTNMDNLFRIGGGTLDPNPGKFNQDIGDWNVAAVTTFNNTFLNQTSFNQDLTRWVRRAAGTDTIQMFLHASAMAGTNRATWMPGYQAPSS